MSRQGVASRWRAPPQKKMENIALPSICFACTHFQVVFCSLFACSDSVPENSYRITRNTQSSINSVVLGHVVEHKALIKAGFIWKWAWTASSFEGKRSFFFFRTRQSFMLSDRNPWFVNVLSEPGGYVALVFHRQLFVHWQYALLSEVPALTEQLKSLCMFLLGKPLHSACRVGAELMRIGFILEANGGKMCHLYWLHALLFV